MSEQDFNIVEGNRYRGSRYGNFAGGGTDTQGNVSSASVENEANISNLRQYQDFNTTGIQRNFEQPPAAPKVSGGLISSVNSLSSPGVQSLNAGFPAAASKIGESIGANVGAGIGAEQGFKEGVSAFANKVSSGLIGSPAASNVSLATKALGKGVYGPPTPSSIANVARGANIGSAFGAGIGTAAATLLATGDFKAAAKSGIGAGVGYFVGNAILPGVGSFLGSTLGSLATGFFGGSTPRVTLGANIGVNDQGRLAIGKVTNKGADNALASKYANSITDVLNRFADATKIKYTKGLSTETNIGSEDRKTAIYKNKNLVNVSSKPGDVGGIALNYLKNQGNYQLTGNSGFDSYLTDSISKAKSLDDLSGLIGRNKNQLFSVNHKKGADGKLAFYN